MDNEQFRSIIIILLVVCVVASVYTAYSVYQFKSGAARALQSLVR